MDMEEHRLRNARDHIAEVIFGESPFSNIIGGSNHPEGKVFSQHARIGTSKYEPHQGKKERARRLRKMKKNA